MRKIMLHPTPPYDYHKIMRRLQGDRTFDIMYRNERGRLIRTIRVQDHVYLIEIESTGELLHPALEITVHDIHDDKRLAPIQKHLQQMLSTEVDLLAFYRHLDYDPLLTTLSAQYQGHRIVLDGDKFECMVKTIIGQQLNLAFAATLTQRLVDICSQPYEFAGNVYPVFPSAEEVASLDYTQLREMQFSQRKAEYVIDFARSIVEGRLDLDAVDRMDDAEVIHKLTQFRGIGRWTAECFLLFGMGRQDLLPAADIGIRNALRKLYDLEYQPSEAEVRMMGEHWTPWSSYVTFYLWETLSS